MSEAEEAPAPLEGDALPPAEEATPLEDTGAEEAALAEEVQGAAVEGGAAAADAPEPAGGDETATADPGPEAGDADAPAGPATLPEGAEEGHGEAEGEANEPAAAADEQGGPGTAADAPPADAEHSDVPGVGPPLASDEPELPAAPHVRVQSPAAGERHAHDDLGASAVGGPSRAMSRASGRMSVAPTEIIELPDFYDIEKLLPPTDPSMLPPRAIDLHHVFSLESEKRNNLHLLETPNVLTSSGNYVVILNLESLEQKYLIGLDGGGIGAVTVHPEKTYIAVAEKKTSGSPNVYIYEYPTLRLHRVLRSGTERSYSALHFDHNGELLATVGSYPDYMLTIWDWRNERTILRSKAFSQEVFNVSFSPSYDGYLTTSGTGHIRFWKMAATFTGLKLQGQIGKFGAVELSDIVGYAELPDGKVVAGAETGELLLWDGGLIKTVIGRVAGDGERRPCHDGMVAVVQLNAPEGQVLTGGADGFIRIWDATVVNDAEGEGESINAAIQPLKEIEVAKNGHIKSILIDEASGGRFWIVLDGAGAIFRISPPDNYKVTRILDFHSGGISDAVALPRQHQAVTAGQDGSLRVYDYRLGKTVAVKRFGAAITCMATLPRALDAKSRVFICGGSDGVVRINMRCHMNWKLVAAQKPHKGAITAVAVSPDGKRVATGGADETVFFFELASPGELVPTCFTKVGFHVSALTWSPDQTCVMVGGEVKGKRPMVLEVEAPSPSPGAVNTSSTYEHHCPRRPIRVYVSRPLNSLVSQVSTMEQALADMGLTMPDAAAQDGDAEADGGQGGGDSDEDGNPGEHHDDTSKIQTMMFLPGDNATQVFLGVSGKPHEGQSYILDLETVAAREGGIYSAQAISSPVFPGAHVSSARFSYCGKFWLMGSTDGRVRATPTEEPFEVPPAGSPYWEQRTHDSMSGHVRAVSISFDLKFLISVADDGSFLGHVIDLVGYDAQDGDPILLPTVREEETADSPDIIDPLAYTIEEAKQKAEHDSVLAAAEAKKLTLRERVQLIHDELERMLVGNESRPEAERLPLDEFIIDAELRARLEDAIHEREEIARKELEWDSAKAKLMVEKLNKKFLDAVECERIAVWGLKNGKRVTTFRCPRVNKSAFVELEDLTRTEEDLVARRRALGQPDSSLKTAKTAKKVTGLGGDSEDAAMGASIANLPPGAATAAKTISNQDARRIARLQRRQEWERFLATKPDEKYENPSDVAAIREAIRTMGDFKLKADPNYVAPEELQMNAPRKRRQMLMLGIRQYEMKADFNHKVLALRARKEKAVADIQERNARLAEISGRLGVDEQMAAPKFLPEEYPEQRYQVTDEDIASYNQAVEEEAKKTKGGGALGGFATGSTAAPAAGADKKTASLSVAPSKKVRESLTTGPRASGQVASLKNTNTRPQRPSTTNESVSEDHESFAHKGSLKGDIALRLLPQMSSNPSGLEIAEQEILRARLEFDRAKLQRELREAVDGFDAELDRLRAEKYRVEASSKSMDLHRLVLHQEWILLKDFEKRETVLMQKFHLKEEERLDVTAKMDDCDAKIEEKMGEVEHVQEKRGAVLQQFNELVSEKHDFREKLLRIFNRRIKRAKKAAEGEEEEDSESDEKEEMDDEDVSDDEDDGDGCPPGCDQLLYEKVCELRERRLNEEDALAEYNKSLEQTKKERESQNKKLKVIETALKAIDRDILDFQREKQTELNKIQLKVTLSMHQIQYLVDRQLPLDLSDSLLFSGNTLERLSSRIGELIEEKAELRVQQKQLHRDHVSLSREMKSKEERIKELESRAREIQLLKFGQLVDLEVVDRLGMDKGQADLKLRLKAQEQRFAVELEGMDGRLQSKMEELSHVTQENTNLLQGISRCLRDQRDMERSLDHAQATLFMDVVAMRKKDAEERDRLVGTVNAQAEEINRLKAEIGLLSQKGARLFK